MTDELTDLKQRHKECMTKLIAFFPPSALDRLKELV